MGRILKIKCFPGKWWGEKLSYRGDSIDRSLKMWQGTSITLGAEGV